MSTSFEPARLRIVRLETGTGIVALELSGELDLGTTPKLTSALVHLAANKPEVLVLDLSGLSFLSVAGARSIRVAHDTVGTTRLRVVTGDRLAVCHVLHATGFAAVLDCYPTRSAAMTAGSRTWFLNQANASWNAGR